MKDIIYLKIKYFDKETTSYKETTISIDKDLNLHIVGVVDEFLGKKKEEDTCFLCGKQKLGYYVGNYFICHDCIEWFFQKIYNGEAECCQFCGRNNNLLLSHTPTVKLLNGGNVKLKICANCLKKDFFRCDLCGRIFPREYRNGVKIKDKIYCRSCYPKKYPVRRYSYKPEPIFHDTRNSTNTDFTGFELEVEFLQDAVKELRDEKNAYTIYEVIAKRAFSTKKKLKQLGLDQFIYLKMDASIGGFEMVSHPFSYRWFKKNKDKIKELFRFLRRIGATSFESGRAGLHFHMNRNNFRSYNLLNKLLYFTEKSLRNIRHFSQRETNHYCSFNGAYNTKYFIYDYSHHQLAYNSLTYHYNAVNLTDATIEWRFFRGTLNFKVFEAYVEFIFALKNFIREYSASYFYINSWWKFIKYCEANGYNNVSKFYILLMKRNFEEIGDK